MIFFFFFKRRWIGILLILLGISSGIVLLTARSPEEIFEKELQALPDYDSCARARQLWAQKKYGEAKALCEDIIALDLPGKKSARILLDMCEKELSSIHTRVWKSVQAFVTGHPGCSLEEAGSAFLSDMLMYGDIRDLVMQGYFKITGRETDPLVAVLAAGGLMTELSDAVDWIPAMLKVCRKVKAISDPLARDLIREVRKAGRKLEHIAFFPQLKKVFDRSGFLRTKAFLRQADRTEDFVKIAKFSEKSIAGTHVLVETMGKKTIPVIEKMVVENKSHRFLKRLLTKGPSGVTLFLRTGKAIKKGNAMTFLNQISVAMRKNLGKHVWWIPAGLIFLGGVLTFGSPIRFFSGGRGKKSFEKS